MPPNKNFIWPSYHPHINITAYKPFWKSKKKKRQIKKFTQVRDKEKK